MKQRTKTHLVQIISMRNWCKHSPDNAELITRSDDWLINHPPANGLHCRLPEVFDSPSASLQEFYNPKTTFPYAPDYSFDAPFLAHFGRLLMVGDALSMPNDHLLFAESYHNELVLRRVLDQDHCFSTGTVSRQKSFFRREKIPATLFHDNGERRAIGRRLLVLASRCARNYWHWLMEILPRLWCLEAHPELRELPVVLPAPLLDFQKQSLEALEIDADQIVLFDGTIGVAEDAFFPSFLSPGGYSPDTVAWLRQKFSRLNDAKRGSKKLFVSRNDGRRRRLVNEPEILAALRGLGFEVVHPGSMTFAAQVAMFSQAHVIVGAHGANLTNMVFSAPGAHVVEFQPENAFPKYQWMNANACGHHYSFVIGRCVNRNQDIVVDPSKVRRVINLAMEQQSLAGLNRT